MERHPLVFLSVVIMVAVLLGTVIGMQLIAQRHQVKHTELLRAVRSDLDELVEQKGT